MPRYNFDLVGTRTVHDHHGLLFADCQMAARFAENLAAELSVIRPDICDRAWVRMSDQREQLLIYCVSIGRH